MFGYIKTAKPELKIKEYETYRAVYCSLCKVLGKQYGLISRFVLNYDFTFLALLNLSLKSGCDKFLQKRCTFNPLKKCNFCNSDEAFLMPAAATVIMSYYKLIDNIADEKGIKRLGCILLKPILRTAFKKAKQSEPQIEEFVYEYITEQSMLEKEACTDIDRAADPSARVLSKILVLCSDNVSQKRVLERLGYCLGRYIYLTDAYEDLADDIKKNSYNVLKNKPIDEIEQYIEKQVFFCINEAAKAFELLEIEKYKTILGNIIYLGLEQNLKKESKK